MKHSDQVVGCVAVVVLGSNPCGSGVVVLRCSLNIKISFVEDAKINQCLHLAH